MDTLRNDVSSKKYPVITCLLLIMFLIPLTAGCVQSQTVDQLKDQLPDRGDSYLENISAYVIIQAYRLNVTLPDNEINSISDKIAKQFSDTYGTKREGWYSIDHNELHITIGRAYGLNDSEVISYIREINRRDAIAYHRPPLIGQ